MSLRFNKHIIIVIFAGSVAVGVTLYLTILLGIALSKPLSKEELCAERGHYVEKWHKFGRIDFDSYFDIVRKYNISFDDLADAIDRGWLIEPLNRLAPFRDTIKVTEDFDSKTILYEIQTEKYVGKCIRCGNKVDKIISDTLNSKVIWRRK